MLCGTHQATLLLQLILLHSLDHIDSAILSRNKTITSISTRHTWGPEKAIDGDPRRNPWTCECCADADNYRELNPWYPWYELDLGKQYTVHRIHVETADDFRSLGIHIYLKSVSDNIKSGKETAIKYARMNVDYKLPEPKSTRYVSLVQHSMSFPFIICELTVYGECADGEYGDYCEHECHCDGDPCNKTTGVCPSGKCLPGYQETACNKECNHGTYGLGCSLTCGNCRGNYTCLFTNGTCPNGCAAGYHGDDCKAECIIGTYGEGCAMLCGACVNWTACNTTNGACLACEPGFFGTECKSIEKMRESATNKYLLLIISGWIFGGVTLVAAVGIIIFMKIKTRRTKQRAPDNDTRLYAIPTNSRNEEEHQYEIPSGNA